MMQLPGTICDADLHLLFAEFHQIRRYPPLEIKTLKLLKSDNSNKSNYRKLQPKPQPKP